METKEMLLETLREDLEALKIGFRRYYGDPQQETDSTVRLSAEIRRVVSLIAEIDHE